MQQYIARFSLMDANLELEEVVSLLNQHKGKWARVCRETGLDYSWITKLAQGRIRDPGYKKIVVLKCHLMLLDSKDAA